MTHRMNIRTGVLGLAAVALFLGSAAISTAQTLEPSRPAGVPQEGIKVRGDWTIEIRHADGTLSSRHEFQNHLAPGAINGSALLAGLLANFYSGHQLQINLEGDGTTSGRPPCVFQGQPFQCQITDPNFGSTAQPGFRFNNLTINVPVTNNDYASGSLELTGNATAARDGVIGKVLTVVHVSRPGTGFFGPLTLTTRDITLPPVVAGQIIQVRIVISFS